MINLEPTDIVAIVIVVCATFLLALGVDGFVQAIMLMVVAYYFGKKASHKTVETKHE